MNPAVLFVVSGGRYDNGGREIFKSLTRRVDVVACLLIGRGSLLLLGVKLQENEW